MFQPPREPTAYLQLSAGYAIPHGLPEYAFHDTQVRLSDGRGSGTVDAGALLYHGTAPLFSPQAGCAGLGPAPAAPNSFDFDITTSSATTTTTTTTTTTATATAAAATSTACVPPHPITSLPLLVKMEHNAQDLAAQEAAARDYQPQLEGPLVGKKTPSTAIVEEYAKADPVYVQKTMVLPQTYSHYRPIQGDGNCGWRAIGFGYFETLIKTGRKGRIEAERQRLEGLNAYIENVGGFPPFVIQDFVDETFMLMDKMAEVVGAQEQAAAELLEAFNTPETSNAVMYHFRMLASSYLKGNRDTYGAFVTADMGIDGYCQGVLERPNVEIDHLGLTLLVNVLLKPADFVLEVVYLDRSAGSEVNTYRFPEEANNRHASELGPMIHLLYRPDHYDVLYTPEPVTLQVHRVAGFSQSYEIESAPVALDSFGAVDLQPLSLIPEFGAPPPGLGPLLDAAASSLTPYVPSPASSWVPSPFADPIQQASPAMAMATPAPPTQTHPLRFSEYCQLPEYVDNNTWREATCQTNTFKNSHFNVAHYNNPNFQPEEYKPEADDHDAPPRGGSRKRGSV